MHFSHPLRTVFSFGCTVALAALLLLPSAANAESYVYDAQGRLVGVTYDDGSRLGYVYDDDGNIVERTTVTAGLADLGVTVGVSADPTPVAEEVTYTFTVTNAGPSDAEEARLVISRPNARVVGTSTPQGSCIVFDTFISCPLGLVTNGDTLDIDYIFRGGRL